MEPLFNSWTNQAHKTKRLDFDRVGFDGLSPLHPHAPPPGPPPPMKRARESEGASSSGGAGRNFASFFDFERYRSSVILRKDEIWAVRDDYGMPRRYVQVERDGDFSSSSVTYLKYNRKVAYQRYKSYGVLHSCGIFVADTDPEPIEPPFFSHKVVGWGNKKRPTKFTIYPRKGEVWAVTKCPISVFGFASPSLIKYQMVEILEDYNSDHGVKVASLVKVKGGYRSLFQRWASEGGKGVFFIGAQGASIDCFSHQVPYFRFSGERTAGDFLELDPSSLPLCVDDPEGSLVDEINDNFLFLALLDKKVSYRAGEGFIWAAYDLQSRVPIKYVAVRSKNVYSKAKLVMHELAPCPIYGSEKRWQEAGLPIACGNFIIKAVETEKRFILSHRVRFPYKDYCMLDSDNCNIHPVEGDVWGLYKDPNMVRSNTPRETLEYHIVVIIGRTEKAITAAYLVRVEGFIGLFRKKSGHASQVQIPANECYRFSHKITSYRFDGRRIEFLKGTFVLDPLLIPRKHGECFSFDDPFLLDRSKAHPLWSAILHIVDKQRNGVGLDGQENIQQQSAICNLNWTNDQDVIAVEEMDEEKPNLEDISPPIVHGVESINPEEDEHHAFPRPLNIKFHDFQDPKLKKDFELGQIWALHSEFDGLPHSYARIYNFTTSLEIMEVILLEPHPMAEEEIHWVEKRFPMACGTFRTSQSTCMKEIRLFSHRVICDEVKPKETTLFWRQVIGDVPEKLFYHVYPRKGEVWAIYKRWNLHWTHSDMKNNRQYRLVEVVSDFTAEAGVTVAALVRMEGREDIFRRHLHEDFELYKTFKRKELLRFSHCIPSVKMVSYKDSSTYEGPIKIKFSHIGI